MLMNLNIVFEYDEPQSNLFKKNTLSKILVKQVKITSLLQKNSQLILRFRCFTFLSGNNVHSIQINKCIHA